MKSTLRVVVVVVVCAVFMYRQHRHTEDIDSNVDVFLSRLVLGGDGVTSRVAPQTDRDGHNRRGVCGLNLNVETISKLN